VLFLDKSPYAKLHNIPVHAVTIQDGFWGKRRETNVSKSIPSMEKLLLVNGRLEEIMVNSFRDVVSYAEKHQVHNRLAAYMLAIDRVASALQTRGLYA